MRIDYAGYGVWEEGGGVEMCRRSDAAIGSAENVHFHRGKFSWKFSYRRVHIVYEVNNRDVRKAAVQCFRICFDALPTFQTLILLLYIAINVINHW